MIAEGRYNQAIERMAKAGAKDSLPKDGMFNIEQLDAMKSARMDTYRRIARIMLDALLAESASREETGREGSER